MAQIQTCPKSMLKNNEWLTFCMTIRDEITSANRDITVFKSKYDKFSTCILEYDNSINRLTRSQYTKLMKTMKYTLNISRTGLFKK